MVQNIMALAGLVLTGLGIYLGIYFAYFRKNEDVSAIIYQFYFSQPDGAQVPSVEIGFTNNGNKNAIISNVALCFPNIHGTEYCSFSYDQETNQKLNSFKVGPGDLTKKIFYFPAIHSLLPEAKYFNEEYGFLNLTLKFSVINNDGKLVEKSFNKLWLTVDKEKEKIMGGSFSGIGDNIQLLP